MNNILFQIKNNGIYYKYINFEPQNEIPYFFVAGPH